MLHYGVGGHISTLNSQGSGTLLLLECQMLSEKIVEWRLYEVKQPKYKLVLGWVTILWVVLL